MTIQYTLISVFSARQENVLGNISAVFKLDEPLSSNLYQQIAADINQPASTFILPEEDGGFPIKWYAPDARIGLCGHGTMAAIAFLAEGRPDQSFQFKSGRDVLMGFTDESARHFISLDAIPVNKEIDVPPAIRAGLGIDIIAMYETNNKYIILAKDESAIASMQPDFCELRKCDIFGYAVTAPGESVDFVSRTLVPHVRQLEDHATGSSHALLTDFWSKKLSKPHLQAKQLSPRGGLFQCSLVEDQVILGGDFEVISKGEYYI